MAPPSSRWSPAGSRECVVVLHTATYPDAEETGHAIYNFETDCEIIAEAREDYIPEITSVNEDIPSG